MCASKRAPESGCRHIPSPSTQTKARGDTAVLSSECVHSQHTVDSGGNGFCLLTTNF